MKAMPPSEWAPSEEVMQRSPERGKVRAWYSKMGALALPKSKSALGASSLNSYRPEQEPVCMGRRAKIARRAVLVLVLLLAVGYAVSYLIASGVTAAEREEQHDHPSDYGLMYEDVEFPSRKGDVTLEGWYLPSICCGPTVIMVHGITSNRSGGEATQIAAAAGQGVLQRSAVRPEGARHLRRRQANGRDRRGAGRARGLRLPPARGIRQRDILVLGKSMGAGASVLAAAAEPEIGALVLDGTYADVTDLVAFEIGRKTPVPEWAAPVFIPGASLLADMLYGVDMGLLVPERAVEDIGYPILVIHGEADTRNPDRARHTRPRAAHPASELWTTPGTDHGDSFLNFPEEYVDAWSPTSRREWRRSST